MKLAVGIRRPVGRGDVIIAREYGVSASKCPISLSMRAARNASAGGVSIIGENSARSSSGAQAFCEKRQSGGRGNMGDNIGPCLVARQKIENIVAVTYSLRNGRKTGVFGGVAVVLDARLEIDACALENSSKWECSLLVAHRACDIHIEATHRMEADISAISSMAGRWRAWRGSASMVTRGRLGNVMTLSVVLASSARNASSPGARDVAVANRASREWRV